MKKIKFLKVAIVVIDDKHCHIECPSRRPLDAGFCVLSQSDLQSDPKGAIRTANCLKYEIKRGKP